MKSNWTITKTVLAVGILAVGCTPLIAKRIATAKKPARSGYTLRVGVLDRVYDGDTIFVTFPNWHPVVGKNLGIRLAGIDTPEIRTSIPKEKALAYKAKRYLEKRLATCETMRLDNVERGKYFRLVANLIVDGNDVGLELIEQGLAVRYDGKKKTHDWSK